MSLARKLFPNLILTTGTSVIKSMRICNVNFVIGHLHKYFIIYKKSWVETVFNLPYYWSTRFFRKNEFHSVESDLYWMVLFFSKSLLEIQWEIVGSLNSTWLPIDKKNHWGQATYIFNAIFSKDHKWNESLNV